MELIPEIWAVPMPRERITQNTLFYGDNLRTLGAYMADARAIVISWALIDAVIMGMIVGQAVAKGAV